MPSCALQTTRVVIFAKAPESGKVKTRLIPVIGPQAATHLARRMLADTLDRALNSLVLGRVHTIELCMSPAPADPAWADFALPSNVLCTAQGDGDLGARMARAARRVVAQEQQRVLLIGTDCPALSAALLTQAAQELSQHDAVMLPASDGGYVLLGLRAPCPELFSDMPWSTAAVGTETLYRMATLGLTVWQGPTLHDIDEPQDLQHVPESRFSSFFSLK